MSVNAPFQGGRNGDQGRGRTADLLIFRGAPWPRTPGASPLVPEETHTCREVREVARTAAYLTLNRLVFFGPDPAGPIGMICTAYFAPLRTVNLNFSAVMFFHARYFFPPGLE